MDLERQKMKTTVKAHWALLRKTANVTIGEYMRRLDTTNLKRSSLFKNVTTRKVLLLIQTPKVSVTIYK